MYRVSHERTSSKPFEPCKPLHTSPYPMASTSSEPKASTTGDTGCGTTIPTIHPDIIENHILPCLDGPTLATMAATSSQFRALTSDENLWAKACHSTWPSTNTPRVRHIISTFPNRSRSFFSDSFSTSIPSPTNRFQVNLDRTPELISAVDVFHRGNLIFSDVAETETKNVSGWFRGFRFHIRLFGPGDTNYTQVSNPDIEDTCRDLREELKLSWIIIDPAGQRAVNVSSQKPVWVRRNPLREVVAKFAKVVSVGGDWGLGLGLEEVALCIWVRLREDMRVRQIIFEMEYIFVRHTLNAWNLDGRDSLVILQRLLEGERVKVKDGKEEEERYRMFEKKRKEKIEEERRRRRRA